MSKVASRIINIGCFWYLMLLLVIAVGVFVRLYKVDNPIADWHSFRQADTASVGRVYVDEGIDVFVPRYHDVSTTQSGLSNMQGYRFVEFPLFSVLHVLLHKFFPHITFDVFFLGEKVYWHCRRIGGFVLLCNASV
jgi:hypothetical protein